MGRLIGLLGEAGSGKDTAGRILVENHNYYSLALADPLKVFCQWMFGWRPEQLWGDSLFRNQVDHNLGFHRCPSCGFHWPDTAAEVVEEEMQGHGVFHCPICAAQRDPKDWLAHLSPRFALQDLGTEWARFFNKRCHIDFALKRAMRVVEGKEFDPLRSVLPEEVLKERYNGGYRPNGVYISDCRFRNEVQFIQEAGGKVYRIKRTRTEDTTTTGIPNHASEVEQQEIADEELDGVIVNDETLDTLRERIAEILKGWESNLEP
jgi:hypothetical protein